MLAVALFASLLLDLILGDPRRLPHPVRRMGSSAGWMEKNCRRLFGDTRWAGIAATLSLIILWILPALVVDLLLRGFTLLQLGYRIIIFYYAVSLRDLLHHAVQVYKALRSGDEPEARRWVSYLVSRDTEALDREGLILSAAESVAENISDGTVGVLLFALLLGPAGGVLFRLVNTLDAMWGYKNDAYRRFGWAAARMDDLLGWLPARITAVLMLPAAWLIGLSPQKGYAIMRRDARKHSSPNSGYPEAVAAGVLGIRFGGMLSYHGEWVAKPYIGDPPEDAIDEKLLLKVAALALVTTLLAFALGLGIWDVMYRLFWR